MAQHFNLAVKIQPGEIRVDKKLTFKAIRLGDSSAKADFGWTFKRSGNVIGTATGANVSRTFSEKGNHTVELVGIDTHGHRATETVDFFVERESGNKRPRARIMMIPPVGTAGQEITFDASKSWDPDGSIVSYEWAFVDSSQNEVGTATGKRTTRTFENPGKYTARLVVTDDSDDIGALENLVTIREAKPEKSPIPEIHYLPQNPTVGDEVWFDAEASKDPDGKITKYEWKIVQGEQNRVGTWEGDMFSTVLSKKGSYTVDLTVTDNSGNTGSTSIDITVGSKSSSTS